MDSSNNETTTHVFFQLGNTTLYSVLGLYLCCVLFYVLSSLFVFLAGLILRGFGLFDYLDSNGRKYNSSRMVSPGHLTQLQILSA